MTDETLKVEQPASFQDRVQPWMIACFGPEISGDKLERGDRLLEEVLELLQSGDYPPERVAALRDYVWGRAKGEPSQEVGGSMVTLAAYCLAFGIDMHIAGEVELARIWTKVDQIRAKQAAKPVGSALPIAAPPPADGDVGREFAWLIEAPGARYLGARNIAHFRDFYWTPDHNKALRFFNEEQADLVMMALKRIEPELFAFSINLGDARAVEHLWLNSLANGQGEK